MEASKPLLSRYYPQNPFASESKREIKNHIMNTRRDFLKSALLTAGGLSATGTIPGLFAAGSAGAPRRFIFIDNRLTRTNADVVVQNVDTAEP